jgi:hypothetical protein
MLFFHNFIFFCSNNKLFINHVLKAKYLRSQIKVDISTHLYFMDTACAEALATVKGISRSNFPSTSFSQQLKMAINISHVSVGNLFY